MFAETCDQCGEKLALGSWPFCPHGPAKSSIVGDDIPGGQWFENGFSAPQKFYSHSEHRAALAASGREIAAKWVPGDKHLSRMDIPCAATLESARILLSRKKSTPFVSEPDPTIEFPITVTDIHFEKP